MSQKNSRIASRSSLLVLGAAVLLTAGCASRPDLTEWRASQIVTGPSPAPSDLESGLLRVERLRDSLDLFGSRAVALRLVAAHPDEPRAQLLASRAESDHVLLLPATDEEAKELALWSALDWAEHAAAARPGDADSQAQLAWCLGATTHLLGMFSRAGNASATLEACERALALNADQVIALRTKATLRLRLATLPWIAKVMAFGAPDGDLDEAVALGRRCVALRPSVENRLLLGKALLEQGDRAAAEEVLRAADGSEDRDPRDHELRGTLRDTLELLTEDR